MFQAGMPVIQLLTLRPLENILATIILYTAAQVCQAAAVTGGWACVRSLSGLRKQPYSEQRPG